MFIGLTIGILASAYIYAKQKINQYVIRCLGLIISFAIIGMFASMLLNSALYSSKVPQAISRVNISAMADGSDLQGHFFLSSGTIKDVQYYYYYESLNNGGFKQKKVTVSETVIFEDQQVDGYMVTFMQVLPADHWATEWVVHEFSTKGYYEFHIPKGSMQREFKLDLE